MATLSTKLVIHVGEKEITVICKDGRVLHFSREPQELRDFILCQIAQHQINGVQALAKCTGWQMLSSSTYQLGCGVVEPLGNAVRDFFQTEPFIGFFISMGWEENWLHDIFEVYFNVQVFPEIYSIL